MDFKFELDGPETILVAPGGRGSWVSEFALGYELEAKTIVLMQVLLVEGDSYKHEELDDVLDLQFGIREKLEHNRGIQTCIDFSLISPRRFIPKDARGTVSDLIDVALVRLINGIRPHHITMETYHSNVPEEAMQKYNRITTLLESLDYRLETQFRDETTGIDYWFYRDGTHSE